jgi:hypothetical protein
VPEHEWFEVDGSTFRACRQVARPTVGRFGGSLTDEEAATLERALHACESAEPAQPPPPRPGASTISIDVDGTAVSYGQGKPPPGPWTHLDEVCEQLCDAIVDRPTAAVGVVVVDDGARLEHRGDEPIHVDLTDASFVAIAWRGWYEEVDRREGEFSADSAEVGPGWSAEVPVDLAALRGDDVTIHVTVTLTMGSGRDAARAEVAHAPDLERPD